MNTERIEYFAKQFSGAIKEEIGTENMMELVENNAKDAIGADFCYSHDYCDANQVFIDVMEKNGIDFGSDTFNDLMAPVWNLAKQNNFYSK